MLSGDPISSGSIGMPKSFMVTSWTIQTARWLSENLRNYQILTARFTLICQCERALETARELHHELLRQTGRASHKPV
jgi:hypothetical protein